MFISRQICFVAYSQLLNLLTAESMSVEHNVLNVNSLVGTFNQEKAPFSVIMNLRVDLRLKL